MKNAFVLVSLTLMAWACPASGTEPVHSLDSVPKSYLESDALPNDANPILSVGFMASNRAAWLLDPHQGVPMRMFRITVQKVNAILARSQARTRLRYAGYREIDGLAAELEDRKSSNSEYLDQADKYAADFRRDFNAHLAIAVTAFTPSHSGLRSGVAVYGGDLAIVRLTKSPNHGAVELSAYTVAHEIGHLLRLRHDRYEEYHRQKGRGVRSSTYPYAFGFSTISTPQGPQFGNVGFNTIMAYPFTTFDGCYAECQYNIFRVGYFSNPAVAVSGQQLGVRGNYLSSDTYGPANAVKALDLNAYSRTSTPNAQSLSYETVELHPGRESVAMIDLTPRVFASPKGDNAGAGRQRFWLHQENACFELAVFSEHHQSRVRRWLTPENASYVDCAGRNDCNLVLTSALSCGVLEEVNLVVLAERRTLVEPERYEDVVLGSENTYSFRVIARTNAP